MDYKELSTNPTSVLLQLVGAKWKLLIVKELLQKEYRFVELKKKLGCTAKVLTSCLKEMEADGLVVRTVYEENPIRVSYKMSEFGMTLAPIYNSIANWGNAYKKHFYGEA